MWPGEMEETHRSMGWARAAVETGRGWV
jgi:hypothetical protein